MKKEEYLSTWQTQSHKSRKRTDGKMVQEIANFLIQEPNFIQN